MRPRLSISILNLCAAMVCVESLLIGHGSYHDNVTLLEDQIKADPRNAGLHFELACAHQEHGEWKAALIECERVRRLAADGFDTGLVEGKALASGGHFEAAKSLLDSFLEKQPHIAAARVERGRVLMKLQMPAEAEKDFEAALQLEKQAPVDWWLEAAQAGKAVEVLRRALNSIGNDPQLLSASLEAELKEGNATEAIQRVDALQRIAPRCEPWMARRAELLQAAGRHEEARNAWMALRSHLLSLPNLERGTPLLVGVLAQTEKALGLAAPAPVVAPPALSPQS